MDKHFFEVLLKDHIEEVRTLDPGYSGHASDVWYIKTASDEVIVRSSRLQTEPDNNFWWGCKYLFGIDPRHVQYMEAANTLFQPISTVPAPKIMKKVYESGREYIVVEHMRGQTLKSFIGQPASILYQLGVWLAEVHCHRFNTFGNLVDRRIGTTSSFHKHMAAAMSRIVERYFAESSEIREELVHILVEMGTLKDPEAFSPVLVDMDPSQFLSDGDRITAIVDTEAYVLGPVELDFIALEYVLDHEASIPFIEGYQSVREAPSISEVRRTYRYLYRILGVQGSVDLRSWFAKPSLFS
ncbi:phosphotransferase [Paenibacillus marinisediminis]